MALCWSVSEIDCLTSHCNDVSDINIRDGTYRISGTFRFGQFWRK